MCAYAGVPVTAIFCHRTRNSAITARCISNLVSPAPLRKLQWTRYGPRWNPFCRRRKDLNK